MPVEEVLEGIVRDADRSLSVSGFRRSKHYFFREAGDAVHRVAFSFRKVRGEDFGWLSVTVCVGFRPLAEFLRGFAEVELDSKRPCMMATDLGHLSPPCNFHEWRLDSQPNAIVASEILERLSVHGLRYFETYGQLPAAVAAWESGINFNAGYFAQIYACAYYALQGQRERVTNELKKIIADCDAEFRKTGQRAALNQKGIFEEFLAFCTTKATG